MGNQDRIYLEKLEEEFVRVISMLSSYRNEVEELRNLNYTPNTIVLLEHIKYSLESDNFMNLTKMVNNGIIKING